MNFSLDIWRVEWRTLRGGLRGLREAMLLDITDTWRAISEAHGQKTQLRSSGGEMSFMLRLSHYFTPKICGDGCKRAWRFWRWVDTKNGKSICGHRSVALVMKEKGINESLAKR